MKKKIAAIILAAGKGTRMKSELPKVLHPVCSRPMLCYVMDIIDSLKFSDSVVVLGHKHEQVKQVLRSGARAVIQKGLRGTADAVKQALPALKSRPDTIIVLYGDTPLLKAGTIKEIVKKHIDTEAAATILTARLADPHGYGRIIRDKYSSICGIAEEKDADDFQRGIKEINTGIICFDRSELVNAIKKVRPNNLKKEYYLTDVIGILRKAGKLIESVIIKDFNEALGINSRIELAGANKIMQKRLNDEWMKSGVTIVDPDSVSISYGTKIGQDTTIYPFTVIEKDVKIGKRCSVGPFAHLRPRTQLADDVTVGNFIEISRSKLASRSRAKHFGFIGDSRVKSFVNIGAGTVTANYDGKHKNVTVIEEGAFIGSDTVLIAPVRIGKRAKTGAGSVVTSGSNVSNNSVVVGVPARPIRK